MLFNSFRFLLSFPCVFLLYYTLPFRSRKYLLLIASYYFYMCWKPEFIILILLSTAIDFFCGLGINLMVNFKAPYLFSTSISDYWKRNHISLSQWFHEYVYISLGGSRKGPWKKALFVTITFFLSGLWRALSGDGPGGRGFVLSAFVIPVRSGK